MATLVWTLNSEGSLDVERRGVIVGIALKPDEGGEGHLNEHEKATFRGIMEMVTELLGKNKI